MEVSNATLDTKIAMLYTWIYQKPRSYTSKDDQDFIS